MITTGSNGPFTLLDLLLLPVGSKIGWRDGITYYKEKTGFWNDTNNRLIATNMTGREDVNALEVADSPPITFEEFRRFVWTMAIGHGSMNGIEIGNIQTALQAVGITWRQNDAPPLYRGMPVHTRHVGLLNNLPNGTTLVFGDVTSPTRHGVYVVQGSNAIHAFGPRSDYGLTTVHAYPAGVEAVDWPEPQEDDEQRVATLLRELWDVGARYKSQFSWCGAFENAIYEMGSGPAVLEQIPATPRDEPEPEIGSAVLNHQQMQAAPIGARIRENEMLWEKSADDHWTPIDGSGIAGPSTHFALGAVEWVRWEGGSSVTEQPSVGTRFNSSEDIAALPPGSVIMYEHDTDGTANSHWNFIVRDDSSSYLTGRTRHLLGPNSGQWGSTGRLVHVGGTDMLIPVTHSRLLGALPAGSQVTSGTAQAVREKREDGTWVWLRRSEGPVGETSDIENQIVYNTRQGERDGVNVTYIPHATLQLGARYHAPWSTNGCQVTMEDARRAPLGTVMRSTETECHYIKRGDGWAFLRAGREPDTYAPESGQILSDPMWRVMRWVVE